MESLYCLINFNTKATVMFFSVLHQRAGRFLVPHYIKGKIEKVPRGIRGEKSSKQTKQFWWKLHIFTW